MIPGSPIHAIRALLLLCLALAPAFAGQSIRVSQVSVSNNSVAPLPVNSPCRVEVSFHDWPDDFPGAAHPWDVPACGINIAFIYFGKGAIRIQLYSTQHSGALVCLPNLGVDANGNPALPSKFATIRYQRIPNPPPKGSSAPTSGGVEYCEGFDVNGRTFWSESHPYTTLNRPLSNGVIEGGSDLILSTAYLRLFSTSVPMGSRPPVTADTGDLLDWKFDGNTNDTSGHGYNGQISGGIPAYVPTPGQTLVVASASTANAPAWSPWISMRAGYPNQLDCTHSYSQADTSATVNCSWAMISGPSPPAWSNLSDPQPTLTGIAFGTYTFQLTVTDAAGNTATTTIQIGAVNYDDNGVLIPSDPKVTELFGPMIAFGQNPWGYADERAQRAVVLQNASFLSQQLDHPTWMTPGQGTVSYPFSGKGPGPGATCTTLTNDITATSSTLAVADASCLSLATLPTVILVGSNFTAYGGGSQEMVRICAASATSGPANLTVCYDGRGIAGPPGLNATAAAAQAWPSGTQVGEFEIAGTGTRFITDANRPLCPAGAPGPPGSVVYSTGSVQLSPGSTSVAGVGTNWTIPNGVYGGNNLMIRIAATHGGGTPFIAVASISSVGGPASLTLSRPAPSDVDPANFSYAITGTRYVSLELKDPSGSTIRMLQSLQWCESETAAYAIASHDIPAFDGTTITGVHYSYKDSLGAQSAFGPNFYGSGLAARAFYLRSGWDFAKQTADLMDEQWVNDPELCNGWCGGIPLLQGGGVIGAFADLLTNPSTKLTWNSVRRFAFSGSIGAAGCNDWDTRDSGYLASWLTLAADYDPDPSQRSGWKTQLAAVYARDQRCKQADGSWANGFVFSPTGAALTVTQGSPIATGNNIPQSTCYGIAGGTVTVFNGLGLMIGTGLVNGNKIVISGTRNGDPYVGTFAFTQAGGIVGSLAALWPGDTGNFSYMIENNDNLSTIGTSNDDPQLTKNWSCIWNNPSQITLDRAWDGPSESNAHVYSSVLAGFGQQPFMLGIKVTQLKFGSQNDDSSISSGYAALAPLAASWIHDVGYDPVTQGMFYGRIYQACEPFTVPTPDSSFFARTPGCNNGLDPFAIRTARVYAAETSQALRVYYEAQPSQDRQAWGDLVYGSIWGYCPYTKPGFYCDENYVRDENSDTALGSYKWPGFFFGMGMAHQWPAVRVSTH